MDQKAFQLMAALEAFFGKKISASILENKINIFFRLWQPRF
jgi:hypothetical protein